MAKLKHYSADAPRSLSDILLYEIDPRYSREHGELAPVAEKVPMGAVLAQNGGGQYVPFGAELSPAVEAVEASEGVDAVEGKDAVLADKPAAILISRDIELRKRRRSARLSGAEPVLRPAICPGFPPCLTIKRKQPWPRLRPWA